MKSPYTEHTVRDVFDAIPNYYDVMNDCMSFGMHRLWKNHAISRLYPIPHHAVYVDLACGTGDIAMRLLPVKKHTQQWILIDPSEPMLQHAQQRFKEHNIHYVCATAEHLPLASSSVHTLTMSFGLRNTQDRIAALETIYRVLEPGGQCMIMEFHKPHGLAMCLFSYYQQCLPVFGSYIAQDTESYTYLIDSIQSMPPVEDIVAHMTLCGFQSITTHRMLRGLVVIYHATKGLH